MTKLTFILTMMVGFSSFAAVQKYTLHYQFHGKHLEVPVNQTSFEDAITEGAQRCFQFYTGAEKLDHDQKIAAVDTCANPRTK